MNQPIYRIRISVFAHATMNWYNTKVISFVHVSSFMIDKHFILLQKSNRRWFCKHLDWGTCHYLSLSATSFSFFIIYMFLLDFEAELCLVDLVKCESKITSIVLIKVYSLMNFM